MKVDLGTMEVEILGMNFGCVLSALSDAKIPEKECLLPLVSKLLGYCIVAASTTVKLPQKPSTGTCPRPGSQSLETLDMNNGSIAASGTTVKILGMDIGYILSASLGTKIPSMDSLLPLLSTVLGYFIIATSTVTKLPQILKILKHGSVRGLSVASFELELIGYTIALAYCIHKGLPFSAYGELAFLLIQAIILIAIIYYYSPPMGSKTWMKALVYCGLAPTVLAGKIDPGLFEILYASQHAIFFCARVPQIWKNFTNKSTGELSFLTCLMNFAGSLVRVFTSIQEKTPLSVLMGSAIGIATNGTILSQIVMYQKPVPKKED